MANNPQLDAMLASKGSILQSGKYSDLTVYCRGHVFKVHRAIVCPRSRFFEKAIDGEFQEAISGNITLADDDPETVKRMFSYLYTLDYDERDRELTPVAATVASGSRVIAVDKAWATETPDRNHGTVPPPKQPSPRGESIEEGGLAPFSNIRVYAIGEKYFIPDLKELACERFEAWGTRNWSHPEFPAMVREVFDSTPSSDRGLRDVTTKICAEHARVLVKNEKFRGLLEDVGELAASFLQKVVIDECDELELLRASIKSLEARNAGLTRETASLREELRELRDAHRRRHF